MTQVEFLKTFNSFPLRARYKIARQIQLQVIDELFDKADKNLPNVDISMDEIQAEIKAFRNDRLKTN